MAVTSSTRFPLSLPLCRLLIAIGFVAAVACAWLPSYYAGLLVDGLIFSIFALSLNLLVGCTGLPSLGHSRPVSRLAPMPPG